MKAQGATAQEQGDCRIVVIRATSAVLWQELRSACDDALAQDLSFVAILGSADAFAEERLLMDEDRQRAARFRQDRDRHNLILGRTIVHYLVRPQGAAAPYPLSRGPHGKPFLPEAPAFNLSHSDRWVACAVSPLEPIGIDVETFGRLSDYRGVLSVIAHPAERQCIEQALPEDRLAGFKRCWTRKEAILKATGKGLIDHLQSIDVCLDQREPVLQQPMPLRLIDLPMQGEQPTMALALAPSVPGVVVMMVDVADIVLH